MSSLASIRILEKEPNKKGDLFGRLIGDYFLTLGYDNIRTNIHKSGREIDIEAHHRTEHRRVIAECKAHDEKIGGDDINKFVGSLDVEKHKDSDVETTGYFISLSGFKETAIEQEKEAGGKRVILVNGNQVVEQLVKGNIIVSPEKAMERAGRCAAGQSDGLMPENACELLAHDLGWIWVVCYSQNKEKTHYSLIHADGEAISDSVASNIIKADSSIGGSLHSLTYLSPKNEFSISEKGFLEAREKYFKYIANECGEIQLEGLPADQEVGARKLNLENIFVPLHLVPFAEDKRGVSLSEIDDIEPEPGKRDTVGSVFSKFSHLAILAAPGGGKSTLLKRIAVSYAFPERRKLVSDDLPDRTYLPIFIRCRQLGDMAKSPIWDILAKMPQRAEMPDLKEAFMSLVSTALHNGEALLLIDGLDEISDEGARISFVHQLRTFLATYPVTNIIVTSREAGFRIVGGSLMTHCQHYKVADFDDDDIMRLTVAWHKEVVGDRNEVLQEAQKLAKAICDIDRVRQLAQNPLLLTTLLLVKRWVGQLPTKRSVLYGKAIEVLLMTWNVEGYEPLDPEEVIPQLAFVAFAMMEDGIQRISSKRLKEILSLARKQMPEILAYAKLSVNEFIERVEFRSSLMMQSGHEIEDGTLYPVYEFRHLTFQEYLAAKAIVEGFYPNRKDSDTIISILEPHISNEYWKEVVPLTAVLCGRKAQPLIEHLIDRCKMLPGDIRVNDDESDPAEILSQCILDEVQIPPTLLNSALEWIIRRRHGATSLLPAIYKAKHGDTLYEIAKSLYATSNNDLPRIGGALGEIGLEQLNFNENKQLTSDVADNISALLNAEDKLEKAKGALALMEMAFMFSRPRRFKLSAEGRNLLVLLANQLIEITYSDDPRLHYPACWAYAWIGHTRAWTYEQRPDVLIQLLSLWRESPMIEVQRVASWAISTLPIIDRELKPITNIEPTLPDFIKEQYTLDEGDYPNHFKKNACLVIGFYIKAPWSDEEIAKLIASRLEQRHPFDRYQYEALLNALGEYGEKELEALKQKRAIKRPRKRAYKVKK